MPFVWMPTGIYPAYALRVHVYVRFEKNSTFGWELPADRSVEVRLPDRTVLITNPVQPWGVAPVDGNWDRIFEFDPYRNDWGEDMLPYVMLAAWNGMTTQSGYGTSTGVRDRSWITNKVKLFGDSGGSQLKSGTVDYVDPKAAQVWMNQVCDLGVPLDVAPHLVDQNTPEIWDPLIWLQQKHNEDFLAAARKPTENWDGLKLLNCVHGFTAEQVRRWCRETHDDRFVGWAVGGDVSYNLFQHLRTLMVAIQEFNHWGDNAHFHMFGSANITKTPAYAWLGRYVPLVTGDGTGWLDGVKYHRAKYLNIGGSISTRHFGRLAVEKRSAMPGSTSPCPCPICASRGGDWRVFSLPRCTPGPNLQLLHEIWTTVRMNDMWSNLAMNVKDLDEYLRWVQAAFTKGSGSALNADYVRKIIALVRYIDTAWNHGVDYADKKFARVLNDSPKVAGNMRARFMSVSATKKDTFGGSYVQPPIRTSILPNYMTRDEMAKFGLRVSDVQPGVAEGFPPKGHARGEAQSDDLDVSSLIRI